MGKFFFMGKRYNLVKILKYWNVHIVLIFTLLGIALNVFLKAYIRRLYYWGNHETVVTIINTFSIGFVLATVLLTCICTYYYHQTGRNYFKDRYKYARTLPELLSFYKNADPNKMNTSHLPYKHWTESTGIILGKTKDEKLIEIAADDSKGIVMFGTPGSGKTVTLISTCLRFAGSIFAIDIKGDIYSQTRGKRKIKLFSPSNPDTSMHYDPFAGIQLKSLDQKRNELTIISLILIQPESGDGKYFADGARTLFMGITLYLLQLHDYISFPAVIKEILHGNPISWVEKVISSNCEEAKEYLAPLYGSNTKNLSGCYDHLCNALRPFNSNILQELLTDNDCCISPFDMEAGYDVYLQVDQSELEIYAPLLAMITQQFISAFTERSESLARQRALRPFLMILDEFPQLKKLPAIDIAFATLRSKKVSILIALQSLAQLRKWYGQNGASEIIDCCRTFLFLKIQDTDTRKWASEYVGNKTTLEMSNTLERTDRGHHTKTLSRVELPIFKPEEFGNLNDDIVIVDDGRYIKAKKVNYYE